MKRTLFQLIAVVIFNNLLFLIQAYGSDINTQKSSLYPYKSSIERQDDFAFGTSSSGSVGELGWNASGTISSPVPITGRVGVLRLDTSAVSGTTTRINMFGNDQFTISMRAQYIWLFRLNTNDANTLVRAGAANVWTGAIARGVYIEKLNADTNWFCVTRNASVETRTDSGIAVNTSFNTFYFTASSTSALFYINNVLVCTHTTNLPAAEIGTGIQITNSAASAKTLDIDYFQYRLNSLTR